MTGAVAEIGAVALAVIAAAQIVLAVVLALTVRRALIEIRDMRARLQETLGALDAALEQVSGLAAATSGAVASAQRLAGHAAALAGAGRAVAESAIGQALLRRVLPRSMGTALSSAGGGSAVAGRFALGLALAAWRALATYRRHAADALVHPSLPTDAERSGAGTAALPTAVRNRRGPGVGEVRRLDQPEPPAPDRGPAQAGHSHPAPPTPGARQPARGARPGGAQPLDAMGAATVAPPLPAGQGGA